MPRRKRTLPEIRDKYGEKMVTFWQTATTRAIVIPCKAPDVSQSRKLATRLRFILYAVRKELEFSPDPAANELFKNCKDITLYMLTDENTYYIKAEQKPTTLNKILDDAGIDEVLDLPLSTKKAEKMLEVPDLPDEIFSVSEPKQ